MSKRPRKPAAPCTPAALHYRKGDVLRINSVEWGHVFAYWEGPTAPGIQYPCCIGCGKPWHVVRDAEAEAKPAPESR